MQQAQTAIKTKASRLSGRPAADTRQALQQAGGGAIQPRHIARAQARLGEMYRDGRGLPPDAVRGLAWLRLAAERGDEKAEAAAAELAGRMSDAQRNQAMDLAPRLLRQGAAPTTANQAKGG